MGAKILSRRQFATLAGVVPSSVTKACANGLRGACVGRRVDASHPAALAYLKSQQVDSTGVSIKNGLDPLYHEAVAFCRETGHYFPTAIRKHFKIGVPRAKQIFEFMRAAGDLSSSRPGSRPLDDPSEAFAGSLLTHAAPVAVQNARPTGESPNPLAYATVEPGVAAGAVLAQYDMTEIPEEIKAFADMTLRTLIQKFGTDLRFKDWLAATKEIEKIDEVRIKNAKQLGQLVSRKSIKTGVFDPLDAMLRQILTDGASTIVARLIPMHEAGRDTKELEEFVREQIGSYIRPMKTKVARGLRNA